MSLPALPYDDWEPTKAAVHLVAQLMGKAKLALHPKQPHWWHATLRVSTRGITTGTIPVGDRSVEIELNVPQLALVVSTSRGDERRVALPGRSIAAIHEALMEALRDVGHPVWLLARP